MTRKTKESRMDRTRQLGLNEAGQYASIPRKQLLQLIDLKLAALGLCSGEDKDSNFLGVAGELVNDYRHQAELLRDHLAQIDQRIQDFLDKSLAEFGGAPRLPGSSLKLDRHGLARELSVPRDGSKFKNDITESYRLTNGVLHNPKADRRTTKGVFHVAAGGLPVPGDKKEVPLVAYAGLLKSALNPPDELSLLPLTAHADTPAHTWVTLHLRPLISPEIPGKRPEQRFEMRFWAPGSMIANLDFVESIFGNAGDPNLPANNAALDTDHWTGTTGCVILAPQMMRLTKKELGLPHISEATERQKKDRMCWKKEDELYNDGGAFKITHRTHDGVMVTLIADNYFGYCKKEIKTQIGFAANYCGLAEEEHAGGAVAYPTYNWGDHFAERSEMIAKGYKFSEALALLGGRVELQDNGSAIDKRYPNIVYLPEGFKIDLPTQSVIWQHRGSEQTAHLNPEITYVHPSGYKVKLDKHPGAPVWRLMGTEGTGTYCHKPSTVSGGGKSEISKSLANSIIYGPIFVADIEKDLDIVTEIFARDYSERLKPAIRKDYAQSPSRPVLAPERSLGSVIKMFTPSEDEFTAEYNAWLASIPKHIWPLVFVIKRWYQPEWGDSWRDIFHVDFVNGASGHQLKFNDRQLVGSYLRIGYLRDGAWRTFKLRQDFLPATKVQREDDITASVVVPASWICDDTNKSFKLSKNCESRLFQRPDEAIHRGYDEQTEWDMSQNGLFVSNFAPLSGQELKDLTTDVMGLEKFTKPMKKHLKSASKKSDNPDIYATSSAHPRIVAGKPTKNPRYLQVAPPVANPAATYLAEIGEHLAQKVSTTEKVQVPVHAVLAGRRNNPEEPGVRPLAVFGPIHYQELPELFMDFISSLTGKSPSTTGAGSEGALTKGPFNAIRTTADLNAALVSFILTEQAGYSSAAGYIGPDLRVDHDISLLVPELWARLSPEERDPQHLIDGGFLEPVQDLEEDGEKVHASRLGYRLTSKFVHTYLGRIFDNPAEVWTREVLQPELQDRAQYIDGVKNITEAHQWVAQAYLDDGSVEDACPPVKALLHIMANGEFEGMTEKSPEFRTMFTKEALLSSEWYQARLQTQQAFDLRLLNKHKASLEAALADGAATGLDLAARLARVEDRLAVVSQPGYVDSLVGTLGGDNLFWRNAL
jgi:hypothetical protein